MVSTQCSAHCAISRNTPVQWFTDLFRVSCLATARQKWFMLRSTCRLLSSSDPCTGSCFLAVPRHLLEDIRILQLFNDIRRDDASDNTQSKVGHFCDPASVILFYCAYVSGSVHLPTRSVNKIPGNTTPLPDCRAPLADLAGARIPIELHWPASLYSPSYTAEDIPGCWLMVRPILGIVRVASCIPATGTSTPSFPVMLIWVASVGLGLSLSWCSGKWITGKCFGDATGCRRSGCSRRLTSPTCSFHRLCTDARYLSLDIAFSARLFYSTDAISPRRMHSSVSLFCKNTVGLDLYYTTVRFIWLRRSLRDYYCNRANSGDHCRGVTCLYNTCTGAIACGYAEMAVL